MSIRMVGPDSWETQTEAEARAAAAGFLWCPAFPFHAHTWRLAAWWCKRRNR
jgi:hypothetical protein